MRGLLRTVGQLSDGVALGERYGYDSGVMLEYVYRNQPSGKNAFGKAIDKAFLDAPGWRGIRARGDLLTRTLRREIKHAKTRGQSVQLLDVACGGGRYVVEALREVGGVAGAVLRDYRQENIDSAKKLARDLDVEARFETADAFSDVDLGRVSPPPNLIIVSGLHEIIADNAIVEQHFRQLARIAARPATLVFTIQPRHPQIEFIARVLRSHTGRPWVMTLRPWEQTRQWAEAAGFKVRSFEMEKQNIFGVVTADLA
jgi:SAM-dependent methyltransferase